MKKALAVALSSVALVLGLAAPASANPTYSYAGGYFDCSSDTFLFKTNISGAEDYSNLTLRAGNNRWGYALSSWSTSSWASESGSPNQVYSLYSGDSSGVNLAWSVYPDCATAPPGATVDVVTDPTLTPVPFSL